MQNVANIASFHVEILSVNPNCECPIGPVSLSRVNAVKAYVAGYDKDGEHSYLALIVISCMSYSLFLIGH